MSHHAHGSNSINSQRIFKKFTVRFYGKFAAKYLLQVPPNLICVATLVTIPCETLRSENERQSQTNAVINDKVQSTVVTYLRCGGFSITK